ncbi:MAG: sigma-70 family RNA polymerase sigma factor [Vicinamibacterales bacterium]
MDHASNITRLLREWQGGRAEALDQLMPLVYRELHAVAARYLSQERRSHTLQPTALVHEAYLKLADAGTVDWQGRAHFFALAARVMRRILVDHAREARRLKRGGGQTMLLLDALDPVAPAPVDATDALAVDLALTRLEAMDQQQAQVVELRFFGGLTIEETADVLRVSTGTVKRDWVVARAWLYRELSSSPPSGLA